MDTHIVRGVLIETDAATKTFLSQHKGQLVITEVNDTALFMNES